MTDENRIFSYGGKGGAGKTLLAVVTAPSKPTQLPVAESDDAQTEAKEVTP